MTYRLEGATTLLEVFDMPRSIRFYRDVLGFEVVMTSGEGDDVGWALLRRDDVELMLNTAYESNDDRPPEPDLVRQAHHGDTTIFFGCRDVDAAYAELIDRGIELDAPVVRDYGMKQLSLRDPDGYGICFQWAAE
jgi:catechol 2,3-dioxygenase-like lactoylglutathione lyase family enzyme